MARPALVSFQNVSLSYPPYEGKILRDINFDLAERSFHFLTGESGAGKTSLMKLLYLSLLPDNGKITLFRKDITQLKRSDLPAIRRQIGIVFQDFRLLDHMTAFDNVALPLRIINMNEDQIQKNVTELMEWIGLSSHMNDYPKSLSGGEQQRVAIARAIISKPKLLIADEPTGNIDREHGLKLIQLFEELNKMGTTIVIATHDKELLSHFPHPHLKLTNGRLALQRTTTTATTTRVA